MPLSMASTQLPILLTWMPFPLTFSFVQEGWRPPVVRMTLWIREFSYQITYKAQLSTSGHILQHILAICKKCSIKNSDWSFSWRNRESCIPCPDLQPMHHLQSLPWRGPKFAKTPISFALWWINSKMPLRSWKSTLCNWTSSCISNLSSPILLRASSAAPLTVLDINVYPSWIHTWDASATRQTLVMLLSVTSPCSTGWGYSQTTRSFMASSLDKGRCKTPAPEPWQHQIEV